MRDAPAAREITDPQVWDRFAAAHPRGEFLQSWRWGELKSRYGWRPVRLALESNGAIVAGVQMLVRTRRVSRMLPAAGVAYVPRGPLAASPDQADRLIAAATDEARRAGASFLRVEPPASPASGWAPEGFRRAPQFVQIPRTAVVDIAPDESSILGGFKPKMRYNIRLAGRRGIKIDQATDAADLEDFYRLTQITARRERFAVHARDYYRDIWRTFAPEHGALLIARFDGEPVAALLSVAFGGRAVYLFGASSNRHREHMAPHALQWAAMRWARARGCRKYDLWGAAAATDAGDPMAGVHRFKLGFNPAIVEYPGAFDLPLQRVRAWALTHGFLRTREVLNRWRGRPVRSTPPG